MSMMISRWSYRIAELAMLAFVIEFLENLLGASEWCSMVAACAVGIMLQLTWSYKPPGQGAG